MCYEAAAVREYIMSGVKESSVAPLQHSQIMADIMGSVLQSMGVKYK